MALAALAECRRACAFLLEDLVEGGEEVGACFDEDTKAAVRSGIAVVLPSRMADC